MLYNIVIWPNHNLVPQDFQ